MTGTHLIVYTAHYREGSKQFAIAAKTLQSDLLKDGAVYVKCFPVKSKKDLIELFKVEEAIESFHFVGHSGMYGPMFGSVDYPEQFSPFEWQKLEIPFTNQGEAYFHCCRSARWFAPFFARIFGVDTYGYHWYTAFTQSKDKYIRIANDSSKIYAIGCKGKKSHGYIGSLKKHTIGNTLEKMKVFKGIKEDVDDTYNDVAELYDAVFQDIKVRKHEWKWISEHFPDNVGALLEIGCGNGALLNELSSRIQKGTGIDVSKNLIERARLLNLQNKNIAFETVLGPKIPMENNSVDVVISMLSFRYLDWDPVMDEIRRVLKPGGRVLILDMVTVPVKLKEYPSFIANKIQQQFQRRKESEFRNNLSKLVNHPSWKKMLSYNPIRSEHEMKWYLESRFPKGKVEKINIGFHSCILAFDSGQVENIEDIKLTYP